MNPLRWLLRIRHRQGYGIHSPWAFSLVTGVIYEDGTYYAYDSLQPVAGWRLKDLRLLFRLTNHLQPTRVELHGISPLVASWLRAACSKLTIEQGSTSPESPHLVMQRPDGTSLTLTVGCGTPLWRTLQADSQLVTFDLHYLGLAYRGIPIPPQHHIINYV